jgi:lipopolysaccharide export system protein LptA
MKPIPISASISIAMLVCLFTAGLSWAAAQPIPVTECGQTLDVKGGKYALTGNLSCGGETITISADRIHFDTAGFSVTSTGNVVAISDAFLT